MDPLATRLRTERERQGLTVRDVAVVTKIREPYIDAIERGRYDVLPAVYVRSFVKTLGGSLGVPDAEIRSLMTLVFEGEQDALRLPRSMPSAQPSPGLESTVQKASEIVSTTVSRASEVVGSSFRKIRSMQRPELFSNRPRFVMALAMLVALALIIVFVWMIASGDSDDVKGAQASAADSVSEIVVDASTAPGAASMVADSMKLTADVTDTSWLTITMDGARTKQQVLLPGEAYLWRAKEKFVLNISNAGGVRFSRDGEPLPLFGKRDETVRSVSITRTDVISSTSPVGGNAVPTSQIQAKAISKPAAPVATPATHQPAQAPAARRRQPTRQTPKSKPAQRQQTTPNRRHNMPIITPAPVRPPN